MRQLSGSFGLDELTLGDDEKRELLATFGRRYETKQNENAIQNIFLI